MIATSSDVCCVMQGKMCSSCHDVEDQIQIRYDALTYDVVCSKQ